MGLQLLRRFWRLRGRRTDQAGTSAIEFAIVFPVLLTVLLGGFEFGRLMWTQSLIDYATQAAARCASDQPGTCGSTTATASYAASLTAPVNVPSTAFTATSTRCGNSVSASYAFQFAVSGLFPWHPTLTSQACYPT